ncbi:MAG: tryptophan synthase subunit alpha [Ferruginibacter sp.]
MNRLHKIFANGAGNKLNIYFTAGYPALNDTGAIMLALQKEGADIIEIGMPYSDPVADGPIIQESNAIALKNGMHMQLLFEQLHEVKEGINIPVILMGYLNPVLQYGIEAFCLDAESAGVSGLIIPDLPMYEYEKFYKEIFKKHHLSMIFLISPETSDARIEKADKLSDGFLYAVSSSSTTGEKEMGVATLEWYKRVQRMKLRNPVLIGFGIKEKKDFELACSYSKGAIIGSAFIKALANKDPMKNTIHNFVSSIKDVNSPV